MITHKGTHKTGIRFVLHLDELTNRGRRGESLILNGTLRLNVAVKRPQNQHQRLALPFFFRYHWTRCVDGGSRSAYAKTITIEVG